MVASSTRINALDSFGTPSSSRTDPIKAMEAADGLYGLRKVLLAEFAGCKSSDANDDLHVVVRTDTGRAIGAVGNSYECFANREFFGPTADALIETGARIDRFQTLADGTRAFMRLSWADDLNLTIGRPKVGDLVGRRCTLSTSHDGKWAGKFTFQMLRLACSNGMTAPVGTFDTTLTHTVGGHQQLIDLQKLVPLIDLYVRQFEHAANVLAATPVSSESTIAIIQRMVDPSGRAGQKKAGGANQAQGRVNRVLELFNGKQPGADTAEMKGTGWGLFNAGVDYFTHEKGTRGEEETTQRFKSLLPGGPANNEILRAWKVVTDGLGVSETIKDAVEAMN